MWWFVVYVLSTLFYFILYALPYLIVGWLCYAAYEWKVRPYGGIPLVEKRFITRKVRSVAVIGGGASGIACAKEAIESGFNVTVFEQNGEIGGNWVYKENEDHSSVYKTTIINTSRQQMSYSDYPVPSNYPPFPDHKLIIKYFNEYAKHFNVFPHIKFNTQVVKVIKEDDNKDRWRIYYCPSRGVPSYKNEQISISDKDVESEVFDAVLIASGHHSKPRYPNVPGLENFKGHVMHSHQYKDPYTGYNFENKRVLIVGIGNSAVDIATELSRVAKATYMSTRTGAYVYPKFVHGKPLDHVLGYKRFHTFILPRKLATTFVSWSLKALVGRIQGSMEYWGIDPKVAPLQMHPTISHDLLQRVGSGFISLKKGNISQISENSVTYDDGYKINNLDAIVFCTGYYITIPYLDKNIINIDENTNEVSLYKNMFSPYLPPTISVIGMIQPYGAIMPISELQARWHMEILKGNKGLPTVEDMIADINVKKKELKGRYLDRPRHTIQVDPWVYNEEIATILGVQPKLLKNLDVIKEILFDPIFPPQFRLNGPGAKPQIAKEMLKQMHKETVEKQEIDIELFDQ